MSNPGPRRRALAAARSAGRGVMPCRWCRPFRVEYVSGLRVADHRSCEALHWLMRAKFPAWEGWTRD